MATGGERPTVGPRVTIRGDRWSTARIVAVPGIPLVLLLSMPPVADDLLLTLTALATLGGLALVRGTQWYGASRVAVEDDGVAIRVLRGTSVVATFPWDDVTALAYDRRREIPIFSFALFDKWSRLLIETSSGWHDVELMKVGWRSLVRTERLIEEVAAARGVPFTLSGYPGYLVGSWWSVVRGTPTKDWV